MAMNGDVLGSAISAYVSGLDDAVQADNETVWKGIMGLVVSHIQTNAQVVVAVSSVSAVTPGAGVSGPGTGSGSIT